MDYVNGIRQCEWGDNLELSVLMRLLDRVILVVQPDGKIENRDAINTYLGDPIFVFYNGHNHYDGFIRTGKLSGRQIYEQLTQFEVARVSSCTYQVGCEFQSKLDKNSSLFVQSNISPSFQIITPNAKMK